VANTVISFSSSSLYASLENSNIFIPPKAVVRSG